MNRHLFWNFVFLVLALSLSFAAGFVVREFLAPPGGSFPLVAEAVEILQDNALFPLPESRALEYGMLRGLLQTLNDPHTVFVEPPQHELQTDQLEGVFGGIGVKIELMNPKGGGGFLLYPYPDGPAAQAGVQNGDRLLSVDGVLIGAQTPLAEVEAAMRGPVGQPVTIAISRPPEGVAFTFSIRREATPIPSVIWHPLEGEPRVGVLQVTLFAETTAEELLRAVEELKGAGVVYFLLDLRDNGGGLLDAGVETARLFLREGVVIEQQYRGKGVETFEVARPGPLAEIPLAVLVNRATASAAEILAGALQAHGRAGLIGEPTFGKDTIQLVFELQDGSSLHVTAARWWFPNLEFPKQGSGLQPDVVAGPGQADPVRAAVDWLLGGN